MTRDVPLTRDRRRAGRTDLRRRGAAALVAAVLVGCGGDAPPVTVARAMPVLIEVPVPVAEFAPGSTLEPIVAGPDGGWLYGPADRRSAALVVVDAGGRAARSLGGYGEGPGEMVASYPLWLDDTVAIGHDLATRRLIVWGRDGAVHREFRTDRPVVPIARGPGTTLIGSRSRDGIEVPVLIDISTGRVSDVVASDDTVLRALFREETSVSDRMANLPAIGRWHDGVVVGNGITYALGLWHRDGRLAGILGRDLPTAQMGPEAVAREIGALGRTAMARDPERIAEARRELEATPVRRFTHLGAPRSDAMGRLWVVVQEGDSVAADVFSDRAWLGRLPLDCPGFEGRWDINGRWLLLVCAPADPASELDAVVRRFRIAESAGDG